MTPKFRAYDGGSLNRMYQPDEVMVGNGDIWIIDEDSVGGEWIVNNDLHLMQSTGILDKNSQEIFEGDIISDGHTSRDIRHHQALGFYTIDDNGVEEFFGDTASLEDFEEVSKYMSENIEIIGNIFENQELLEDKE
jgi:hypothetical protein|nr:MAG TPA: YopX protein [Caudoviricetes sp.]